MAFMLYRQYQTLSGLRKAKEDAYMAFAGSRQYVTFFKLADFMISNKIIETEKYMEYLVVKKIDSFKWNKTLTYTQYVKDLNIKEKPIVAAERTIKFFTKWAEETGNNWCDYFREASSNEVVHMVKTGRVSPWVFFLSDSSQEKIADFSEEQLSILESQIDTRFWEYKFESKPKDVELLVDIFRQGGL